MKTIAQIFIMAAIIVLNHGTVHGQWVQQISGTSTTLTSVFFTSADTGYVSLESGFILKTVNGGQNWNLIAPGPATSLHFTNTQTGFGAFDKCILKTINGAQTWDTCFKNPNVSIITSIHFPSQQTGYATAFDTNIGSYIIKTSNAGVSWDTITHINNDLLLTVFFNSPSNGYVAGIEGIVYKTTDGGQTWSSAQIDLNLPVIVNDIHFPTTFTGYAATDGAVYKTTDGGTNWSKLNYTFSGILHSIYFTGEDTGCVAGGNGFNSMILYQTVTGGNTWAQGASGVQTMLSVHFPNSSTGYTVGTNGTILKYDKNVGINLNANTIYSIHVYPNPSAGLFIIESKEVLNINNVEVYDIFGKRIQPLINQNGNVLSLNLIEHSKGMYFIKIGTYSKKLIIE